MNETQEAMDQDWVAKGRARWSRTGHGGHGQGQVAKDRTRCQEGKDEARFQVAKEKASF